MSQGEPAEGRTGILPAILPAPAVTEAQDKTAPKASGKTDGPELFMISLAVAILLATGLGLPVPADQQPALAAPSAQQQSALVQTLYETGTKVERPRAVVWFDAKISPAEQQRWGDLISKGVEDIETFLGLAFGSARLEYFVADGFGSTSLYSPGPTPHVLLPVDRVQRGAAPYLHETVHHLVFRYARNRTRPPVHTWILEGFPSYVEDAVAEQLGGTPGRVFTKGGNGGVDGEAQQALSTGLGREIVEFIGRTGTPSNLATDREHVASRFYVMAQSFTKFLIETIGLHTFTRRILPLLLNSEQLEAQIQLRTTKSLDALRREWLGRIESLNKQ
jgi:hypothetical protein